MDNDKSGIPVKTVLPGLFENMERAYMTVRQGITQKVVEYFIKEIGNCSELH
ncbi:hypothetical protein [Hespellia stercorisuis]|uniref:hypothetical protein n=1 Tax=Hespellia stercorisuis TaxID=180311 RepID=UPI001356542B|nr:hypothetical protein [Hespellia stercorisuis]